MVDLGGQYASIKNEIDKKVLEVVQSTAYINGPEVKAFQQELEEYLGVKHVVPCANGTDALQVALMAMGLKPGDEVITATFTFVATAEVIALLGLKPVLVDVDPETFQISPEAVKAAITDKTKVIVPVHLFGQCAPMEEIMEIANAHNLFVIEDTAQAVGADYIFKDGTQKKAGSIGHVGATSFFPSKNLGCYGDGGAIFTNDDELAYKMRYIVNHGMETRYHHDEVGVNSRLDSIQAAILRVKLSLLDSYNAKRKSAADAYDAAFAANEAILTPKRSSDSTHVFHQYTLRITNGKRDEVLNGLQAAGIPCAIYYPIPLHMQKAYLDPRYKEGDFQICEELCRQVLSLPMHTELDEEQIDFITSKVIELV